MVGPQVRELRLKKGWLQDQTARTIQLHGWDISREQFNRLENQSRQVLDTELMILAEIMGVGIDELFPSRKWDESKELSSRRGKKPRGGAKSSSH